MSKYRNETKLDSYTFGDYQDLVSMVNTTAHLLPTAYEAQAKRLKELWEKMWNNSRFNFWYYNCYCKIYS